ncbi:MAG: hypothetical protein QW350_04195 [Candidatus Aenigmatarchaeota archaeon]
MYEKIIIISILFLIIFICFLNQKVEIIYFFNDGCIIVNDTNNILFLAEKEFQDKILIKKIDLFNPKEDEKILIEKYNVKGVPTIIINGKEYIYDYNYTNFKFEICKNFVIKPVVC